MIHKMSKDRTVLSEVGSKDSGILISPNRWIKMMTTELQAGTWKVIAEGREALSTEEKFSVNLGTCWA